MLLLHIFYKFDPYCNEYTKEFIVKYGLQLKGPILRCIRENLDIMNKKG